MTALIVRKAFSFQSFPTDVVLRCGANICTWPHLNYNAERLSENSQFKKFIFVLFHFKVLYPQKTAFT